jgi:TolB-like protein
MDRERRRQVGEILAAARERAPRERPELLAQACGADLDLRREIEALLADQSQAETLQDLPAAPNRRATHRAGSSPAGSPAGPAGCPAGDGVEQAGLAPSFLLGPYEVVAQLGAGGMGEVYRARDPRLRREVAIKVLSRRFVTDPTQLRRFDQEARAAGALNHPNILAVFDVGLQDGIPYVVTELLVGETLRDRLRRGPPPLAECLEAARQVAAGLAAAHEKGIVHRDLKPANLFWTGDRRMKILDFGLAKQMGAAGDATLSTADTLPGTILGTVGYMAPEQLRGQEVDARADLFSFGAVLYEMLAGSRAFGDATVAETMSAILVQEPPALPAARAVPAALEQLVRRCLQKDRSARPAHGRELCACLDQLAHCLEDGMGARRGAAASLPTPAPAVDLAPGPSPAAAPAVAQVASPVASPAAAARHTVAVLPFVNLTSDPDLDYFCEGIADELINALVRLEGLRVASRLSLARLRGKSKDAFRRLGDRLRVDQVLQGSVRKLGARLRIAVQLVDVAGDCHLWSEQYDREMADVFAVQDEIALRVAEALRLQLAAPDPARGGRRAANLEAYHLYLRGRHHLDRLTDLREALRCFAQAIERDPGYAHAYAGLADSYAMVSYTPYAVMPPHQGMPRAKAAALRAIEVDPELADAYACLGFVKTCYEWDWAAAEADFQRSLALDPGRAMTHMQYSHLLSTQGRFDAAIAEARRAWELDRLSLSISSYPILTAAWARRFDEPWVEPLRQLVESDADLGIGRLYVGWAYAWTGRWGDALRVADSFAGAGDGRPPVRGLRAYARARGGDAAGARQELGEMHAAAAQRYMTAWIFAVVYTGLGENGEALSWLERAFDEHDGMVANLGIDPIFDPLRGDPRFEELLRRLALPSPAGVERR